MGKKIKLSHSEVEVKVFLEVLAVLTILILAFSGLYYFEPGIMGHAIMENDYLDRVDSEPRYSDEVIQTMLFSVLALILSLLVYNLTLKGKIPIRAIEKAWEGGKEEEEGTKELQNEMEKDVKRKEQPQRSKKIDGVTKLKELIKKKDLEIKNLKKIIKAAFSEKKKTVRGYEKIREKVKVLEREKESLLKNYEENVKKQKSLDNDYETELSELKGRYGIKAKDKEVAEEYKELFDILRMELKARYDKKKENIRGFVLDEDMIKKLKNTNDEIKENKSLLEHLEEKIKHKDKLISISDNDIKKLAEERERAKGRLKEERERLKEESKQKVIRFFLNIFSEKRKDEKRMQKELKEKLKEEEKKEARLEEERRKQLKLKEEEHIRKEELERGKAEKKWKVTGKSRLFVKCYKSLLKAIAELEKNNTLKAKNLYSKTRDLYIKLEYHEKKEIYSELTELYKRLNKAVR